LKEGLWLFTVSSSAVERPNVTVVVPTRDRWWYLRKCLELLARQTSAPEEYEVVVVDDGSTDGTPGGVEALRTGNGPRLRCLRKPALGPAAARNAGVREAEGEVVLFLGDDIMASQDLVARHMRYHRENPDPGAAALGHVTWSPELRVTPFMRWLEEGGPQFAYGAIRDPSNVAPAHFYTANLSVKRAFMMKWGLFDESLRSAAFEDFDLGRRLARMGMRLALLPEARAYHLHLTTLGSACRRMRRLGEAAAILSKKYPEFVWIESSEPLPKKLKRSVLLSGAALAVARLVVTPLQYCSRTPSSLYRVVLDMHFRRGVRESIQPPGPRDSE
jgi:GT2 family glycosyltransferase